MAMRCVHGHFFMQRFPCVRWFSGLHQYPACNNSDCRSALNRESKDNAPEQKRLLCTLRGLQGDDVDADRRSETHIHGKSYCNARERIRKVT
jgi:hypothetical protein